MASIHITFKETDPDDMTIYRYLQSLGRKNRSVLLKILARKTIEKYPFLFDSKHASGLLALVEQGCLIPNSPQQVPIDMVKYQTSPFSGKKPGKKRGPKPKKKNAAYASSQADKADRTNTEEESTATSVKKESGGGGECANADFYRKMSNFLEDGIYNT